MREWEKNIRVVEPYVPGEQPDFDNMIKLNTNENPYPPAPGVEKALTKMKAEKFRLYPDLTNHELTEALAEYYKLNCNQIFVGVGSDDVLAMAFLTFFNSQKPILFPDITYSFYDVWANLYKIPYQQPPLDGDFHIIKEDYFVENGGIVLANPNAPTSIGMSLDCIREILDHNQDVIVIVDEAYVDFGGQSTLPLLKEYENLLVVQTFSKSRSMAGMRIGYAMGNPDLIKAMNHVKHSYNSYTMNQPSLAIGAEAVKDESYFTTIVKKIMNTRERIKRELQTMGFYCCNSQTNFLFITHESVPAKDIFMALRKENIFVRYFDKPRINNYLRVTIGTEEEMDKFLQFLRKYLCEIK